MENKMQAGKKQGGVIAPQIVDLVRRVELGGQPWEDVLGGLRSQNKARSKLSTFQDGGGPWLKRGRQDGSGTIEALDPCGFHMVSMSGKNARISWNDLGLVKSTTVVHLLIDLSNNIDHNLYLSFGDNVAQALRFSNKSLTWIESASVIPVAEGLNFITLVKGTLHASIFVNGSLKLRKAHKNQDDSDHLLLDLLPHQSADLGAIIHGLEVWEQEGRLEGLDHADDLTLQEELSELIEDGNIGKVCTFLNTFDGIDPEPLADKFLALLDDCLKAETSYPDWAVEQVLGILPTDIADEWRERSRDKLPSPQVEVEGLSVRLYRNPATKWAIGNLIRRKKAETFQVLQDINFNVYKGDIIGIIGANGAGKSTLLKILNGLVPIERGSIIMRAKPLLLSPGLGIRDEMSGRENIKLACCFMGLTIRETEALYDEIVEFSELEEFIDQPYKFYSDGMKSRLVFSIATAVAPDIIMLDELLNAGDIGFQQKAAGRMEEVINRAKVVIIVTHSVQFVLERCNKSLLINRGKQIAYGDPKVVVARYLDILQIGDLSDTSGIIVSSG